MISVRWTLTTAILAALTVPAIADESPATAARSDGLELLLAGPRQVRRLNFRVSINSQPLAAVWDDTFAAIVEFFDRDGDGGLNEEEARRLPNSFTLRQLAWAQIAPKAGAIPMKSLDRDHNGRVSAAEFADHGRRQGLGDLLVSTGAVLSADRLTNALLQHLDIGSDGEVNESEWRTAAQTLLPLDRNADELIGPGELVGSLVYPGASGSKLTTAIPESEIPKMVDPAARLFVLASSGEDRSAKPEPSDWQMNVKIAKGVIPALDVDAIFERDADRVRWRLRGADSQLATRFRQARELFDARFDEMDANKDGAVERSEIKDVRRFEEMIALVDRNADCRLSRAEQTRWLDLLEKISSGYVNLTILDFGAGLFELLDQNADGGLSRRELDGAWERLTKEKCIVDGRFDRSRLPQQWLATLSRGQPTSPFGNPRRSGPDWFVKMDRNGDGDVSHAEFLGDASIFRSLDRNSNDQIEAAEATSP